MDVLAYEELTGKAVEDKRENWRSLCPIHDEKTPSFYIHKESYLCHCFGCGASGYLDSLLAKRCAVAPQIIRNQLHIPLIRLNATPELGAKAVETFNRSYLASFERISTHPFLKKRGFKSEIITYAGARWDPSGRIVFPLKTVGIFNTVGAAGRTVKNEDPKWYFYWNTRKGNILYQPIDTLHIDIIVEGVLDVLWLFQHGYTGAAALLGSKATKQQVDLIKANTNEVTLFLDNDEAGRIGQEQLAKALKGSITVYFAKYPKGKNDPQELTAEELHEAIDKRQTYIEYHSSREI